MEDLEKKITEATRTDRLYDLLAEEGHNMSKDQLRRIAMELAYGIHRATIEDLTGTQILQQVANELVDWWGE